MTKDITIASLEELEENMADLDPAAEEVFVLARKGLEAHLKEKESIAEPIIRRREGVDVDDAMSKAIQTVQDEKAGADLAIVNRVLSALDKEIPTHIAEAIAKSLGEAMAARMFEDPRIDEMDRKYRELAQHALNVVVAFQIRAVGTTCTIAGGFEAHDLETAVSISQIKVSAVEAGCEGTNLAAVDDPAGLGIFGAKVQ